MEKVDQSADHGPETPPKKRAREAEDDADDELEGLSREELAKMSRSERKRHREKKRRSDVNKGFDELTTLLLEIDPTVRAEAEERARRGQWKGNFGAQEDNLLSRVDLISRAVDVLRRVHSENEERKQIIASLSQPPGAGGSNLGFESAGAAVGASGGSQGRDRAAAMIDEVSCPRTLRTTASFTSHLSSLCVKCTFPGSNDGTSKSRTCNEQHRRCLCAPRRCRVQPILQSIAPGPTIER